MDLTDRTVVVTGANSGLGLATSKALAARGARVVMACRDTGRGEQAAAEVRASAPGADVQLRSLDLADLSSVRSFADTVAAEHDGVDALVNNAGIMMLPTRQETADGFEAQLGTNHLGHFALTGLLLPLLLRRPGSRVVAVSSVAARGGRIDFDDLMAERHYRPSPVYGQSKLANLLFAFELERRLRSHPDAVGADTIAVVAHPGVSSTNLLVGAGVPKAVRLVGKVVLQGPEQGARPQVHAVTGDDVRGGDYLGPKGPGEVRGRKVTTARVPPAARDASTATRLWSVSQDLTGVRFLDGAA